MENVQKTRFEELQAKGWKNLSGDERREFQELKEESITKVVKAPVLTTANKNAEDTKEDSKKVEGYIFTTNVLHGSKLFKAGEEVETPIEEWLTHGYVTPKN